jgi:(S)-2-hydroxy-acid oxidase
MTLSSWSTTSLEDVAAAGASSVPVAGSAGPGAAYQWFQLYVYKDRAVTLDLIRRAEKAGYAALAITVDTPILGRREADVKNKFALPPHLTMANFASIGGSHSSGPQTSGASGSGLASYVAALIDQTLSWQDIAWVRRHTTMKIVVKGVLTPEDAVAAVQNGVDAVWVSNHGARQLDTTPATIEMLPSIVHAVRAACQSKSKSMGRGRDQAGNGSSSSGGSGSGSSNSGSSGGAGEEVEVEVEVEVYLDGGIMRGTDVLKALALGARAVFLGRPVLWGLAHSGEQGVAAVLQLINAELVLAMKLIGSTSVGDLRPSHVRSALRIQSRL